MDLELWSGESPDGSRLRLRPWGEDDLAPLADVRRDPALSRWASLPTVGQGDNLAGSQGDAARWLDAQRRGWADGTRLSFAVYASLAGEGVQQLAGGVVLKRDQPGSATADVGYWTAGHLRGRGVASRALEMLCTFSGRTLADAGLRRWHLLHQVDNPASCRVAEKTGFRFQRILPAQPPFPRDGHLHTRPVVDAPAGGAGADESVRR